MTVKYFATIRTYTGETARRIEDTPADLRELLQALAQRYGVSFRRAVFADGTGGEALNSAIIILVNGRNILYLQGLETPLHADDEISDLPYGGGGLRCGRGPTDVRRLVSRRAGR